MAASALACPQQHRATYTVRPHGSAFVVVRELSGPGVLPVEEEFTSRPIATADAAYVFALETAERFMQRHPTFAADVRPAHAFRNTGTPEVVSAHA